VNSEIIMIDNEFIEKLEELALEKKKCEIVFLDDAGRITLHDSIEGVYEREEGMVLQLQSGSEILLARLIRVDGMAAEIVS